MTYAATPAHPLPAGFVPQFQTVPSIRWDDLQAPTYATPARHYAGHLPDGSSVQAHSADPDYRLYGIVMVCHESARGKPYRLWTATRYGRPLISGPCYCAVLAAARGLAVGA